jgi:hypothetical protein
MNTHRVLNASVAHIRTLGIYPRLYRPSTYLQLFSVWARQELPIGVSIVSHCRIMVAGKPDVAPLKNWVGRDKMYGVTVDEWTWVREVCGLL